MGKGTKGLQKVKYRNTQTFLITYIKFWFNQQYIVEYGIQRIQNIQHKLSPTKTCTQMLQ